MVLNASPWWLWDMFELLWFLSVVLSVLGTVASALGLTLRAVLGVEGCMCSMLIPRTQPHLQLLKAALSLIDFLVSVVCCLHPVAAYVILHRLNATTALVSGLGVSTLELTKSRLANVRSVSRRRAAIECNIAPSNPVILVIIVLDSIESLG